MSTSQQIRALLSLSQSPENRKEQPPMTLQFDDAFPPLGGSLAPSAPPPWGPQARSAPQSSPPSSRAPQSPSAHQASTSPTSQATQAQSAPQPSSPESLTQHRSRKENPLGNTSGIPRITRPDNSHRQQSESPNEAHSKQNESEDITSRDHRYAEPPKSPSSLRGKYYYRARIGRDFSHRQPSISPSSRGPQAPPPQSSDRHFPPLLAGWGSSAPQSSASPPLWGPQAPSATQPSTSDPSRAPQAPSKPQFSKSPPPHGSQAPSSPQPCRAPPSSGPQGPSSPHSPTSPHLGFQAPSTPQFPKSPPSHSSQAPSSPQSSRAPPSSWPQAPSSPPSSPSPFPSFQAPSAHRSPTSSSSRAPQSPPQSSDFPPLWGSRAPSAPQSSTSPSRATQAPSAPQSSSSESLTQQYSRKENPWGDPSSAIKIICPDSDHYQQSESPLSIQIKSVYIIRSDKCAKPKKAPASPPNMDYRPGQDHCYYEREIKKRDEELGELKVTLKKLEEKERRRAHEFSLAEKYHEETRRILQSKIELDGMQTFTDKADHASVADVIDLVKALNAAILQLSAFISDPQHLSSKASEQDIQQATEVIRTKLGREMADAVQTLRNLRKELHPEDPTPVQLALQIAMTKLCDKITKSWTQNPETDKWLKGLYEKIRASSESQTSAGRWRALTRAQAGGAKDPAAIVNHLIDRLGWVLLAIGSKFPADKFRNSFQKHLTSIANNIILIQVTTGESITSVDVMPYFYAPGTEFRSDSMDDFFGFQSTSDRMGPILGTTELGLWLMEKKADATGQMEDANTPLFKAKVLFASDLRE